MTVTEKKKTKPSFQELPDTSSELTLILETTKYCCCTPAKVGLW